MTIETPLSVQNGIRPQDALPPTRQPVLVYAPPDKALREENIRDFFFIAFHDPRNSSRDRWEYGHGKFSGEVIPDSGGALEVLLWWPLPVDGLPCR